jgi:hypothetical protein
MLGQDLGGRFQVIRFGRGCDKVTILTVVSDYDPGIILQFWQQGFPPDCS